MFEARTLFHFFRTHFEYVRFFIHLFEVILNLFEWRWRRTEKTFTCGKNLHILEILFTNIFFLYLGPSTRVKKKLFVYFVLSDFVVIKIVELFTLSIPVGMHGRQRLKMSLQKIAAFNDTRQRLRMMIKNTPKMVKRNKIFCNAILFVLGRNGVFWLLTVPFFHQVEEHYLREICNCGSCGRCRRSIWQDIIYNLRTC